MSIYLDRRLAALWGSWARLAAAWRRPWSWYAAKRWLLRRLPSRLRRSLFYAEARRSYVRGDQAHNLAAWARLARFYGCDKREG